MLSRAIGYFDINRDIRPRQAKGMESQTIHSFPQWLALLTGVLVQPSFQWYRSTGQWKVTGSGWALFSVITPFIIFPSVYRAAFDGKKPLIVLLAPIYAAGLGWESLVGTAVAGDETQGERSYGLSPDKTRLAPSRGHSTPLGILPTNDCRTPVTTNGSHAYFTPV